jgi:DNA-binding PadR family transcriptional regulator
LTRKGDWGGFPYVLPWGRGRFFGAGEVRIAILSLLGDKPRHGYDLMKELGTRSAGSYRVSAGTMYPALQQLEDEGMIVSEMIVSETRGGKRVYQLTEPGRQELQRERATADDIWRRTSNWGDWGQWMTGSSLGPLMNATLRAMQDASRDSALRTRVEEILDRARRELEDL